jgi:exopolysaccharide biosynthesis polyprenyl glycosylphosphotransferase
MSTLNYTRTTPEGATEQAAKREVSSGTTIHRRTAGTVVAWAWLDLLIAFVLAAVEYPLTAESAMSRANGFEQPLAASLLLGGLFGVSIMLCSHSFGLYPHDLSKGVLRDCSVTALSVLFATLLVSGSIYLVLGMTVSRKTLLLTSLLTYVAVAIRRGTSHWIMKRRYRLGVETRNVLIVGLGDIAVRLRKQLDESYSLGFRFKGFISPPAREGISLLNPDLLGDVRDCISIARSLDVEEIYITELLPRRTMISIAEQARRSGIDVRLIPDLHDDLAWNARVENVGQFPSIPLVDGGFPHGSFLAKRLMDLALATIALCMLWPIMALAALIIRIESRGPIFYLSERVGCKGRKFTCLKFRSMIVGADQHRTQLKHLNERQSVLFKIANDPRVSKVGGFLRRYSLDELPQLVNVLRGEMSLVGPRPPLANEVEQYQLAHLKRLDVLPGMTGLWQVEARQDPSFDNYVELDRAYIENWNLLLDLRILARTLGVVLTGTGS